MQQQANGTDKISPVRLVKLGEQGILVYPNPTNDKLNIRYQSMLEEATTLEVFDISGRLISRQKVDSVQGNNQI